MGVLHLLLHLYTDPPYHSFLAHPTSPHPPPRHLAERRVAARAPPSGLDTSRWLRAARGLPSRPGRFRVISDHGPQGRNKKLVGTSASLLVTGALLVVTRSY